MEHYYVSDPSAPHDLRQIAFRLGERELHLTTDAGVFSRDGLDFGTALMHRCLPPLRGRVLDLGCGWGALSLPLALVSPPQELVCADINRRALELCRMNAQALGVPALVVASDGFSALEGKFAMILTNPPIRAGKEVYYPWFAQAPGFLEPGGLFACVVQKKQGAPSVRRALEEAFGACEELDRSRGYWVLAARAPDSSAL